MTPRAAVVRAIILLAAWADAGAAQEPKLPTVLERAGEYVAEFHRQLSGIVAEERYVQKWETIWSGPRKGATDHGSRRLLSDLFLVRPPGTDEWLQFRDVFEVDGASVRDRHDRLTTLLRGGVLAAQEQINRIRDESARYNLGNIDRNVNTPLLALRFLTPANQRRFRFKRTADRDTSTIRLAPAATGVFRVSAEVWAIQYEEVDRPTLIRTNDNKSLPSRGRLWIEPDTGRVLMSELRAGNRDVSGTIDVSYQSEPLVGMLVPIEMREDYRNKSGSHITGVATYSRFRQIED